jgi:hypothetical protein
MFRKRDQPIGVVAEPGLVPEATRDLALALVRRGKMIPAIKEVLEVTGMSLKDAKTYVEALRDGRTPPAGPPRDMLSDRVRVFLRTEDVDAAVALVRAETGLTRPEAERFIASLD